MIKKQNIESEFYIPLCSEKNCKGNLAINFDFNNFTINYQCGENKAHKGEKVYFQTFDKFFMKKRKIRNCSRCSTNLENENKYRCNLCKSVYCPDCYLYDEHIQKNMRNLKKLSKKCQRHNCMKNNYCFDCGKNICSFCIKNNACESHKIKNILDIIPSLNDINSMINKIKSKKEYIFELINSIDKWKTKLINKIDTLKQSLENEINILEKLFLNFNQHYLNYTYHFNFQYLKKHIDTINNIKLKNFFESPMFKKQTLLMMEILFPEEPKIKQRKGILKDICEEKEGKIAKINDKFLFYYLSLSEKVEISYYNRNKDRICYYKDSYIDFKDKIYSISFSKDKQKIYACLLNKKVVKIFNYFLENVNMKLTDEEIRDANKGAKDHFTKCIELINNLVATEDYNSITIWKKFSFNKYYSNEINIKFNEKPYGLLLINSDCFVSTLYDSHKIVFFNFNSEEPNIVKIIPEIDSNPSENCLTLYKEYILINCVRGIAIIEIKTLEKVQYIVNLEGYENKIISVDNNNNLIILNAYQNISIMKLKFENGCLIPFEEYRNIEVIDNKQNNKQSPKCIENVCENNDNIIAWGKYIYVLKDIDENIL